MNNLLKHFREFSNSFRFRSGRCPPSIGAQRVLASKHFVLLALVLTALSFWVLPVQGAWSFKDLGTLGGGNSLAVAINNNGQVVGDSYDREHHAFVWDAVHGMQDLGTLDGGDSHPTAINENGQIIGSSMLRSGEHHAFVWDTVHGMQDLGTLGGSQVEARAINDKGQVVGSSFTFGDSAARAFVWDAINGMQDLGTLGGEGDGSAAMAINEIGQVAGRSSRLPSYFEHAFIWDAVNGMRDIGTLRLGSGSYASFILDNGQVVGTSETVVGSSGTNPGYRATHGFVWDPVGGMRDIGTLGGLYSLPLAANQNGQVVGISATVGNAVHAFIWDRVNGIRDLGTLGGSESRAYDINKNGQIVGGSSVGGGEGHAFVWDTVHGMQDLGTLGGRMSSAYAINESGQIVGVSLTVGNGALHAFLATFSPVPINSLPVAKCKSMTTSAGSDCSANASIDDGSFDPDIGDTITLTQTPAGPYPVGRTPVTLTVADSHGASASCVATVTVVDTTPPTIACPVSQTVNATSLSGAVVLFGLPIASDNCSIASVTCSPVSGSTFAIGTTTVTCIATDGSGNTSTCSFTVKVKNAAEQAGDLTALVQNMPLESGIQASLAGKLQNALTSITDGKQTAACGTLKAFLNEVNAQSGKKLTPAQASQLTDAATRIKSLLGC